MSRMIVKCSKCEYKESIISTSMSAQMPPCPRCEDFIRMEDITPVAGQSMVISTAGSQIINTPSTSNANIPSTVQKSVSTPSPKRRDMRDFGPEPRN
jgi:hypothetical protein